MDHVASPLQRIGLVENRITTQRTRTRRVTGGIRMNTLRRLAAAALLLLVAAAPAFAQGTTGSIEGRISDEQGLALPGATVFARNTATGFARSVVTDATGIYRFPGLPIGTYEVKAVLAGHGRDRDPQGRGRQRVAEHRARLPHEGRHQDRGDLGPGRGPAHRHQELRGRGGGRHRADREPAPERTAVREPGRSR